MRNFLLFLMLLALSSCTKSDEERAKELVEDYLADTADDHGSVEVIDVRLVERTREHDLHGADVFYRTGVTHYRERNANGALVKKDAVVRFDDDITKIDCFDCFK